MDAAIGVGRAVVQHPRLRVLAHLHQARVEVEFVPVLEGLRLPLGRFAFIGKSVLGSFSVDL